MPTDINLIYDFLKFFGLNSATAASGWLVSIVISVFMIWRMNVLDKKQDEYINKLAKIIEEQEKEWRTMINKTDEMTFNMLQTTTQTMTLLGEKINTLQLLLIQLSGHDKK